jgi:hypothetical protein
MIKKQQLIYLRIQNFLTTNDTSSLKPLEIKNKIVDYVAQTIPDWKAPEIKGTSIPPAIVVIVFLGVPVISFLALTYAISVLVFLTALIVLTGLVFYFRRLEKRAQELPENEIDNYDATQALASIEDFQIQNQLTHLVEVRQNFLRRIVQRLVLYLLDKLVVYTHNKGALGTITSIHFARWLLLDNDRRLLFLSNYDGNWESYIGDFIDRNADGLTMAWSNTEAFPKTNWLMKDGAVNEELFKAWIRKYQIKTNVWYTAYKDLTVKNILRNYEIVRGMEMANDDSTIVKWLKLL